MATAVLQVASAPDPSNPALIATLTVSYDTNSLAVRRWDCANPTTRTVQPWVKDDATGQSLATNVAPGGTAGGNVPNNKYHLVNDPDFGLGPAPGISLGLAILPA